MPFELKKNTINEFHKETVRRFTNRPFLSYEDDKPLSYGEYALRVSELRLLLAEAGLRKADPIILLGPASPHWAVAFMAIMSAGYVAVPVMEDFPAGDINHIVSDSGARAAIAASSYMKRDDLDALKGLIPISLETLQLSSDSSIARDSSSADSTGGDGASAFTDHADPKSLVADGEGCFPTEPSDVAELLYTSGTTGHSKAVMLTHDNLVTNLYEGTDLIDECFDEDTILLSLLPMAHAFGSTSAFLSTMYKGPLICFLRRKPTPEYLQSVFRKVRPTILGGVPLIFEKIFQKKIQPVIRSKKILSWSVPRFPAVRKGFYRLAGRSVLDYFGGRLKCIIIGGATFSEQVETFMREARIPYLLGYGMSETSPLLTFSSLKEARFGSVGHAVRHTSIRIARPDEEGIGDIEVTGPQVMKGYYRLEEETRAAFCEDGWLRTGDRGWLDEDGFLFIRGRSKNVIVGSSGENIYPEVIETMLTSFDLIEESIVYMEGQELTALVYPDAEDNRSPGKDSEGRKALEGALERIRVDVNSRLALGSRISRIEIQDEPFIKTPTRKIKRALYVPGYQERA